MRCSRTESGADCSRPTATARSILGVQPFAGTDRAPRLATQQLRLPATLLLAAPYPLLFSGAHARRQHPLTEATPTSKLLAAVLSFRGGPFPADMAPVSGGCGAGARQPRCPRCCPYSESATTNSPADRCMVSGCSHPSALAATS